MPTIVCVELDDPRPSRPRRRVDIDTRGYQVMEDMRNRLDQLLRGVLKCRWHDLYHDVNARKCIGTPT